MLRQTHWMMSIALLGYMAASHAEATAQKCTDGVSITYANRPCEELGLTSAGPLKNSVTVLPALALPQQPAQEPVGTEHLDDKAATLQDESAADTRKASQIIPINPLIKKLIR